jgi:biopolymer transport protein ExbB/TolQ
MISTFVGLTLQSDLFTQVIVYTLFFLTIFIFSAFLYIYFILKKKKYELFKSIEFFKLKKLNSLTEKNELIELCMSTKENSDKSIKRYLNYLNIIFFNYFKNEKKFISIFSFFVTASPLVGLIGTVWGIINSFIGISLSGVNDLASVAPGIASALITTFAGIFVAIPALIFYYVCQNNLNINIFYTKTVMKLLECKFEDELKEKEDEF